jgi:hypothetical protein
MTTPTIRMNVFIVRPGKTPEDKSFWTKVGVAFKHRKGAGFNIQLDALPTDGQLVMLPPREPTD